MDMSQYAGQSFIRLEDVRTPRQETIADVQVGNYDRPELIFESGDILSLNKTNVRTLIKEYGEDSRNWVGCVVELYAGQTDYKGQPTDSVLVRPITPAKTDGLLPRPKQKPAADEFSDEIPY